MRGIQNNTENITSAMIQKDSHLPSAPCCFSAKAILWGKEGKCYKREGLQMTDLWHILRQSEISGQPYDLTRSLPVRAVLWAYDFEMRRGWKVLGLFYVYRALPSRGTLLLCRFLFNKVCGRTKMENNKIKKCSQFIQLIKILPVPGSWNKNWTFARAMKVSMLSSDRILFFTLTVCDYKSWSFWAWTNCQVYVSIAEKSAVQKWLNELRKRWYTDSWHLKLLY